MLILLITMAITDMIPRWVLIFFYASVFLFYKHICYSLDFAKCKYEGVSRQQQQQMSFAILLKKKKKELYLQIQTCSKNGMFMEYITNQLNIYVAPMWHFSFCLCISNIILLPEPSHWFTRQVLCSKVTSITPTFFPRQKTY